MSDLRCLLDQDDEGAASMPIALAWLISNASEDCYCAGWLGDCEHYLWDAAHGEGAFEWGMGSVPRKTLDAMLELSKECGQWVRWVEDVGVQPIGLDEWEKLHTEWRAKWAGYAP